MDVFSDLLWFSAVLTMCCSEWFISYFVTHSIIWLLVRFRLEPWQPVTNHSGLKSDAVTTPSTLSETREAWFSGARFP